MSASIKRGKVIRADLAQWDGRSSSYSRLDASGGTITGVPIGNEVDVLQVYGAGTNRTRAAIAAATAQIGTNAVTLVFAPGTWSIDSSLTIPSNFTCHIPRGCVFSVDSGQTLTFSGPIQRESETWYSGAGTVAFTATNNVLVHTSDLSDILYPQTAAEIVAGVTATNELIPSHDAVGYVLPHRYGWSTSASGTTNYTALVNANLVAIQADSSIHLGAGNYAYKPSAELVFTVDVSGEGFGLTSVVCDTGTFSGRFFRCSFAAKFHDFSMDFRPAIIGTGIFISDTTASSITGYMALERVGVYGGAKGIEIGNCFVVGISNCRVEDAVEGVWCVPDATGGFGLVYEVKFTSCEFNGNVRNVHFAPSVNSYNVMFDSCAIENATGAVAQADFQNIFTLSFTNCYSENANTITAFRFTSVSYLFVNVMDLQDTGQFRIDDNSTVALLNGIEASGANAVLNSVGTTNRVSLKGCTLPSSGNTLGGAFTYEQTYVNGIQYLLYGPTTGSGTLTLAGGVTGTPTGAFAYSLNGSHVDLTVSTVVGVSTTTGQPTLSSLPAAIRPSATRYVYAMSTDNSVDVISLWTIATNGVITLFKELATGFTAANNKGVGIAATVSYDL